MADSIQEYFSEWARVFFRRIWHERLLTYDELKVVGWEWQSVDGFMVKAPLALEALQIRKKRDETECSARVTLITRRYGGERSEHTWYKTVGTDLTIYYYGKS